VSDVERDRRIMRFGFWRGVTATGLCAAVLGATMTGWALTPTGAGFYAAACLVAMLVGATRSARNRPPGPPILAGRLDPAPDHDTQFLLFDAFRALNLLKSGPPHAGAP